MLSVQLSSLKAEHDKEQFLEKLHYIWGPLTAINTIAEELAGDSVRIQSKIIANNIGQWRQNYLFASIEL